jgi:hypothetical protein
MIRVGLHHPLNGNALIVTARMGSTLVLERYGKGWRRHFDEPIPLPRGRQLVTLEDAGNYIGVWLFGLSAIVKMDH